MARRSILAPSLLSADLASMGSVAQGLLQEGVQWLHLDIMDGHFVSNLTFGPPVLKALRPYVPGMFLDAHLMVTRPLDWLRPLLEAKVDHVTIHAESERALEACFKAKEFGFSVGLALKPGTSLNHLEPCLKILDLCLLMSVEPGFGGQSLMEEVVEKVKDLRALSPPFKIQMDGGIQASNMLALQPFVDVFVLGSALFPRGVMDVERVREALCLCEGV
jgi:ribulose-phosphate 3-epimerase